MTQPQVQQRRNDDFLEDIQHCYDAFDSLFPLETPLTPVVRSTGPQHAAREAAVNALMVHLHLASSCTVLRSQAEPLLDQITAQFIQSQS